MPNEREDIYQTLTYIDYDVAGNQFRAYFDADKKLVFVLDFLVNDIKPNVLLVINPVGGRKWDDILMNDYGVDLETIRPKKDNKYQKLDIEYSGLGQYDGLIEASENNGDVNAAVVRLDMFRVKAARRAAFERLGAAEMTAERTRETIEKTNDAIEEHQSRLKGLRVKLSEQRRDVGKEPTKQSAAKILRTESQIDATNDKLGRAKKRLANAQNRLVAAEEEAEIAREILYKIENLVDEDYDDGDYEDDNAAQVNVVDANLPANPIVTDVAVPDEAPLPVKQNPEFTEITTYKEPKAEEMADDEVKPLFDEDPDILDDEIAFKPIDFGNLGAVSSAPEATQKTDTDTGVQPLSFVPPVAQSGANLPAVEADEEYLPQPVPMLDSLTPVVLPSETIDPELLGGVDAGQQAQSALPQSPIQPAPELAPVPDVPMSPVMPEPVEMPTPIAPQISSQAPGYSTDPDIVPAPVDDLQRPVSPISGNPVVADAQAQRKPTVIYYVLLVVLIALSIFTLWFYQKKANVALPELGAASEPEVVEVVQETKTEETPSPFVEVQEVVAPAPVVVEEVEPELLQVVEPEPVPVTEPQPIEAPSVDDMVSVPVTPEPVVEQPSVIETPFVTPEEVQPVKIPTVEEVLARKPAYNVSQNEKMFVADADYETDDDYVAVQEDVVEYDAPVVYETEPQIVNMVADSETLITPEYAETQAVVSEEVETCADGAAPDMNGCCAGEEFVEFDDGDVACCVVGTDECFPPMY